MEGENTKAKILIFGGTGYIGKYMVKASVSLGHKTFVYARPITEKSNPSKLQLHKEFQEIGVIIIEVLNLNLFYFFFYSRPSFRKIV